MIASVRGRVLAVRLDAAVVEVGGVGLLVQATPATLAELRPGAEAELATSLVVREDALTLFGFADADERDVFEVVQTVSGIGPRLALAMLAVHTPDGLRAAVAARRPDRADEGARDRPQGRAAHRPRADRPARRAHLRSAAPRPRSPPAPPGATRWCDALVGLGWSAKQAADAVEAVAGRTPTAPPADVAGTLRAALRHLGRSA